MSAVVGMMSLGDVERGLTLGRLAGELETIANVVDEAGDAGAGGRP